MISIKPVLYVELVYKCLDSLFNSGVARLTKDNCGKYHLNAFKPRLYAKHIRSIVLGAISGLNAVPGTYTLIFDSCRPIDNELNELYMSKLSKRKMDLIKEHPTVKYWLKERFIRIDMEKFSELFDKIFDEMFKKCPVKNVYFVRCSSIPAMEAYRQSKEVFGSVMENLEETKASKFIKDANDFLYGRLSGIKYESHEDFKCYVKKLVYPYA